MNRNQILLFPLLLFLALFLLDKLALIPAVRNPGRPGPTPLENMVLSLEESFALYHSLQRAGKESRPYVLFLGSSRSEFFQYLDVSELRHSPFLRPEERARLTGLFFEPRYAYKAADIFVQLVFLDRILKKEELPDLLVLEFSPEMLNRNSPSNIQKYIYENILDPSFLWEIYPLLEGEEKGVVQNRLLFSSYAYRFRPEKALVNALTGKDPGQSGVLARALLKGRPVTRPIPGSYEEYPLEGIPAEVFQEKFIGYTRYLREEFVLRDFTLDRSERRTFSHILKRLESRGVKTVVWIPRVHPLMEREWERIGFPSLMEELRGEVKERGMAWYDAWQGELPCLRFVDSSHLSARCAPPLVARILGAAREQYPRLPW